MSSAAKTAPIQANITFPTVLKMVIFVLLIVGGGYLITRLVTRSSYWINRHSSSPSNNTPANDPNNNNNNNKPVNKTPVCDGKLVGSYFIGDSSYCEGGVNKDATFNQVYDLVNAPAAGTYMATQGGACSPIVVSDGSDVFCNEKGGGEASDFNAYSSAPFTSGKVYLYKSA